MAGSTYSLSLVVPHPTTRHILLLPADKGWQLPVLEVADLWADLHLLQRAARQRLGAELTVLRWLRIGARDAQGRADAICLAENHTVDWSPPRGAQWVDSSAFADLPLVDEHNRRPALAVLDEFDQPVPEQRVPWMRPGWFRQAARWTTDTLLAHGYTPTGVPEQFKMFSLSTLIRTETATGAVFFKAPVASPLFCDEPRTVRRLGTLLPRHVPTPIAIDETRRWMLSEDFGSVLRGSDPDPATLIRMATEFAALQIAAVPLVDTLFESGCLNRRLPVLSAQIDDLLADDDCVTELADHERAAWQATGPALRELCERLAGYAVPETLVHGDFHAANVSLRGDDVVFFDWTDACIAHPFFDLPVMVRFDAGDDGAALEDAYLRCWTDYEPIERLWDAYRLAGVLSSLHQAVSYRSLRANSEPAERHEWDWGVPRFARAILHDLPRLPQSR